MSNGNGFRAQNGSGLPSPRSEQAEWQTVEPLHPAWRAFLRYCQELGFGEIDRLTIQDGLPVLAELTTKKVKFSL